MDQLLDTSWKQLPGVMLHHHTLNIFIQPELVFQHFLEVDHYFI
jgi:hypothetical protein